MQKKSNYVYGTSSEQLENFRNEFLKVSKIHKILRNKFNKRYVRQTQKNIKLLREINGELMGLWNGRISQWHRLAILKLNSILGLNK